jgi:hypothetical protein
MVRPLATTWTLAALMLRSLRPGERTAQALPNRNRKLGMYGDARDARCWCQGEEGWSLSLTATPRGTLRNPARSMTCREIP